jgi:chemotaxis-related protein WspB
MLLLTFTVAGDLYAIEATTVEKVLPPVTLRKIPGADVAVAGILDYMGKALPVVDLAALYTGQPCLRKLSSRILIVKYRKLAASHLLGLLVAEATDTINVDSSSLQSANVASRPDMGLGSVLVHNGRWVQLVQAENLFPESLDSALFPEASV